jgi:hypothetical protein
MALPGVKTIIKDRFYSISRQDIPVGPKICLIARRSTNDNAGNVKDLDVVQATTEQDVMTAFGANSDAHRGYFELIAGGAERIFIVPLPKDTEWNYSTGEVSSTLFGGTPEALLSAAFEAAEAVQADIIVPWGRGANSTDFDFEPGATANYPGDAYGFVADNASSANSFVAKIGAKVKAISENSYPCFAVMGIKPYVDGASEIMTPGEVSTHVGSSGLTGLIDRSNSVFETGLTEGAGKYVTVISTEIKPVNYDSSWGFANGATTFAAAISRMASFTSPVNKTAYNVASVRYNPTRTQQQSLADSGSNFIALNFNKVPVFVEGLTMAPATSDYTRISTLRIITEASTLVRQVCQKFVGEASTLQTRNSMETAITSALRGMQQMGALLNSDFSVSYIAAENKAFIDLVLTPAFELKTIEVQVSINI